MQGYVEETTVLNRGDGEALLVHNGDGQMPKANGGVPEYLKTKEAAAYLRKSVSWMVKRHDIPYLRGVPNIYRRKDLDSWFERNKFEPGLN